MNKNFFLSLLAGVALLCGSLTAHAANVDVSLDLFPTTPGNPGGGGTFSIYEKTDAPFGISAIYFYISNINQAGLAYENDIAALLNSGGVFVTPVTGGLNILYGQDTAAGPLVFGVGTATTSDGPDPLGNPLWNGATKILTGTYAGLPAFIMSGSNKTDAHVFTQVAAPPLPTGTVAAAMNVSTVVRFAPEPAAMSIIATSLLGLGCLRRT
jgi:hypothetical protein